MVATIKGEKGLPLFEHARQFEIFENYEDEDHFFVHCLESNGFSDKDNAQFMGLSQQGFSARKSRVVHENSPRFSLTHHHLYILRTGDPRPAAYAEWLTKKANKPDREVLMKRAEKVIDAIPIFQQELKEILIELKGKQ